MVLAAAIRRLPRAAVFSGRTAAWLHGLDLPPFEPIEVTLPLRGPTSRLVGINRMVDAGYRLLRFTAADVLSAPESVVALVRRALRNHD